MKFLTTYRQSILPLWQKEVNIAPLITFRLVFGVLMVFSTLRFWYLGWIEDHFVHTRFTFKYFGFEWVQLLSPELMYLLHGLMLLGAIGILLGAFYRFSALLFFLCFTYIELIDLTYYLNHYYFVSLISFLLIWVPANRRFSLDVRRRPELLLEEVPAWTINIFKLQIAIVYIYAGMAKMNHAWLMEALPLKIWLPAHDKMPVIGPFFSWEWTPYLFSWIGMIYDTTIVFFLSWPPTRVLAYASVVVFHTLTGLLFQIGVFPLVMMGGTWIFFSPKLHEKLLRWFESMASPGQSEYRGGFRQAAWIKYGLIVFIAFQLLFPWRYLLYPGNIFWTEEGYRFSWRVMLMEKAGTATFYVKDSESGREGVVQNSDFLKPHQEKQMAMQADMILQFAEFLRDHYEKQGVADPSVRAEVFVTLNGQPSRLLFDPYLDLTGLKDTWTPKDWIYPYEEAPRDLDEVHRYE